MRAGATALEERAGSVAVHTRDLWYMMSAQDSEEGMTTATFGSEIMVKRVALITVITSLTAPVIDHVDLTN